MSLMTHHACPILSLWDISKQGLSNPYLQQNIINIFLQPLIHHPQCPALGLYLRMQDASAQKGAEFIAGASERQPSPS